jgi:hypothetical protein
MLGSRPFSPRCSTLRMTVAVITQSRCLFLSSRAQKLEYHQLIEMSVPQVRGYRSTYWSTLCTCKHSLPKWRSKEPHFTGLLYLIWLNKKSEGSSPRSQFPPFDPGTIPFDGVSILRPASLKVSVLVIWSDLRWGFPNWTYVRICFGLCFACSWRGWYGLDGSGLK